MMGAYDDARAQDNEFRHYWSLMSGGRGQYSDAELRDEFEVMAIHAHNPALRAAAAKEAAKLHNASHLTINADQIGKAANSR